MQTSTAETMQTATVLTVAQVAKILQISKTHAYAIVHRRGFPSIRVGRCLRIPRTALDAWLERQAGGGNGER